MSASNLLNCVADLSNFDCVLILLFLLLYMIFFIIRSSGLPGVESSVVAHPGGAGVYMVAFLWRNHDEVQAGKRMHQRRTNE